MRLCAKLCFHARVYLSVDNQQVLSDCNRKLLCETNNLFMFIHTSTNKYVYRAEQADHEEMRTKLYNPTCCSELQLLVIHVHVDAMFLLDH